MNREQAVALTKLVQAACPQQAIDKFTPKVWYGLLDDLDFTDCQEAVKEIGRRQPFISPAEIRTEVKRVRADRIAHSVIPAPPAALCADPREYRKALIAHTKLAADGHALPAPLEPRAITGPDRSGARGPTALGAGIADLRKALGPGRPARPALGDERQVARDQVAELRARREERGESA